MRIAFCTTCKGRLAHLSQTLPKNLADNADYRDCVFVVLDFNDQEGLADYIHRQHKADLASGKLVYFRNNEHPRFRMALAKNMAARCGIMEGGDILVTLDSDNLTGPGFAAYIAHQFKADPDLSFLSPDFAALPPRGQRFNAHNPMRLGRGFAGRLAIRAQDFVKVGGYDNAFETWRGEDLCIIARLNRLGLKKAAIDPIYLNALAHGSEVRFKEYPDAARFENDDIYEVLERSHDTVVNYGDIGLGTVFRNSETKQAKLTRLLTKVFRGRSAKAEDKPIKFDRMPTRIFGIGLQRTGTSSLHEAFQSMGFDSAHWESAEWARTIWWEMNKWGRSATLERSYALCDNPIPQLYQKLDAAYPGSKFILTVRDEDEWLRSVDKFWTYEHNPQRWVWDGDGFSHKIHSVTYGQATFDADVFRAAYRRHNAEVVAYFSGRSDLLVLDIKPSTSMDELCRFLGASQTGQKFPHRQGSAELEKHRATKGNTP